MPSSGDGQGSPLLPAPIVEQPYNQVEELDSYENCAVSLSRYAKLVGFDEPALWGVVYENQTLYNCDTLWTESDRLRLSNALATAQQMLEQYIGYPLCPTWVTGTVQEEWHQDHRWVDQQSLTWSLLTRWPRLIAAGIRASTMIEQGSVLTHGSQVAVVGPIAVSGVSADEVVVYYPDTSRKITPSRVTISGGNLTIEIPRYRLVKQGYLDTPEGGIMYEDMTAYLTTVDVVRVYNDPSKQAVLVRPGCRNDNCYGGCGECTRDACVYLRDPRIGQVSVRPATWNTDTLAWDTAVICGTGYSVIRLYYLCGMLHLNLQAENAIVHLAHTLLATPPCACDWLSKMWEYDKEYPSVMTREILNNPFGKGNGAWSAFTWAKTMASVRMMPFP